MSIKKKQKALPWEKFLTAEEFDEIVALKARVDLADGIMSEAHAFKIDSLSEMGDIIRTAEGRRHQEALCG